MQTCSCRSAICHFVVVGHVEDNQRETVLTISTPHDIIESFQESNSCGDLSRYIGTVESIGVSSSLSFSPAASICPLFVVGRISSLLRHLLELNVQQMQ